MSLARVLYQNLMLRTNSPFFGSGLNLAFKTGISLAYFMSGATAATPTASLNQGIVRGSVGELAVTPLASPGMAVRIQTAGDVLEESGNYEMWNVGTETNITIGAADVTNPRKDIVVVRGGAVVVVQGSPNASPADPTLSAGDVVLARVDVAANATDIQAGNITDLRKRWSVDGSLIKDASIVGAKLAAGTFGLDLLSWRFRWQDFTAGGSSNAFTVDNGAHANFQQFAVVSVGSVICKYASSPAAQDEYSLSGTTLTIGGANLSNGTPVRIGYAYQP